MLRLFARGGVRGCQRYLIIWVLAAVIFFPLFCCLVALPLWYVSNNSEASIWYLVIPLILLLVILFGGGALAILLIISSRKRELDALFTPLGFTGKMYNIWYRQYHGVLHGRTVNVYFSRGPLMQVEITSSLQTRMGITGQFLDTQIFSGLLNKQPLVLSDPALSGLSVYAHDEHWTRQLLAEPQAQTLVNRLVKTEGWFIIYRRCHNLPGLQC